MLQRLDELNEPPVANALGDQHRLQFFGSSGSLSIACVMNEEDQSFRRFSKNFDALI